MKIGTSGSDLVEVGIERAVALVSGFPQKMEIRRGDSDMYYQVVGCTWPVNMIRAHFSIVLCTLP
ncbi:MAG: hypothetical protein ACKPKO_34745, partial [Candidatus Fonsibacter sp.]